MLFQALMHSPAEDSRGLTNSNVSISTSSCCLRGCLRPLQRHKPEACRSEPWTRNVRQTGFFIFDELIICKIKRKLTKHNL